MQQTHQLKRLGDSLRDQATLPSSLPGYAEVIGWYDELSASLHESIASMQLEALAGVADLRVTSRAKTIETLRDKLQREWPIRLPSIQDLAGVRIVGDMSLRTQDDIVQRILNHFDHGPDAIRDMRTESHSGYRAVHIWLRTEEGRAEIQIRTRLQNEWANAYEALADLAGRQIRYGGDPEWLSGTPESLRTVPGLNPRQIPDLAAALRVMSDERIVMQEAMRTLVSLWPEVSDRNIIAEQAEMMSDMITEDWKNHPVLKDQPSPEIDLGGPTFILEIEAVVVELEKATFQMLKSIRGMFESIRREIEKGSQ